MAPPLVWLITGSSSGLGFDLALHVLAAGHQVVATVRSRVKSHKAVHEIETKGGKVLELDVSKPDAVDPVAKEADACYGRIDVLVNNAGYSLLGAAEDFTYDHPW